MEETIESLMMGNLIGQPFRITYKGSDFQVRISQKDLSKNTIEIAILLDGIIQTLMKDSNTWRFKSLALDKDFANDIYRSIALRYRL